MKKILEKLFFETLAITVKHSCLSHNTDHDIRDSIYRK